jgi:hypothetical protein
MRRGTRLVALVAALPLDCSAVEECLRRTGVEEASRILEVSGRRQLKANLELGRRYLKLLKKSVLSVSSSMRHTLHSVTAPVRARKSPLTHQPPRSRSTFHACACDLLERCSGDCLLQRYRGLSRYEHRKRSVACKQLHNRRPNCAANGTSAQPPPHSAFDHHT